MGGESGREWDGGVGAGVGGGGRVVLVIGERSGADFSSRRLRAPSFCRRLPAAACSGPVATRPRQALWPSTGSGLRGRPQKRLEALPRRLENAWKARETTSP
eukprot:2732500-Pyramimonas_sp.AAC.1